MAISGTSKSWTIGAVFAVANTALGVASGVFVDVTEDHQYILMDLEPSAEGAPKEIPRRFADHCHHSSYFYGASLTMRHFQ